MGDEWFISSNGKQQGPVTFKQIQTTLSAGKIPRGTLVWRDGFAEWLPIEQVPEFGAPRASAPAPPPRPMPRAQPMRPAPQIRQAPQPMHAPAPAHAQPVYPQQGYAQQGYPQQGRAPQGYPQPSYPAQRQPMRPMRRANPAMPYGTERSPAKEPRPVIFTIFAVLNFIWGGLYVLAGLGIVVLALAFTHYGGQITAILALVGFAVLVMSAPFFIGAVGLLKFTRGLGFYFNVIFFSIMILLSVVSLIFGKSNAAGIVVGLVFLAYEIAVVVCCIVYYKKFRTR